MTDNRGNAGDLSDDMSDFLQMFLDETEEQLDGLVETMLALEQDSTKKEDLNEAFRLIHSIKGSAGMMGFDSITALTRITWRAVSSVFDPVRNSSTSAQ